MSRTPEEQAAIEKKLRIIPGKLPLFEKHLAIKCHQQYQISQLRKKGVQIVYRRNKK